MFALGWDHWVNRTGTIGAIGGMGFLAVILCNVSVLPSHSIARLCRSLADSTFARQFAGTNIGTTILLCRIVQSWLNLHAENGTIITNRLFWGTVYSMAVGVNYGAFSTAFSASLAGLLWRDILGRKHITVTALEFARTNIPIITVAMAVGLAVLVGEVWIIRNTDPYTA